MSPARDFLAEMARASRVRAGNLAGAAARAELARALRSAPPPRPLQLSPQGFDLVAEIKRCSPANGVLAREDGAALAARARAYEAGGACALSVLTEPSRFEGALEHLTRARAACALPVMRKDFLVDELQVHEARAAGADGVLLIARLLEDSALTELVAQARALGMFVLLEAFDERDLERALAQRPAPGGPEFLVGVNARDLATLAVDSARLAALARQLPADVAAVAESGLESAADAHAAARAGYRLALVGSALMRATDPRACVAELVDAGRKERARCASS